ncbi:MAG: histidine--tRNA ligase [Chloroflexota bacterium]|nr:histidine--tRNA ligase [Chloroflexota bacterium]
MYKAPRGTVDILPAEQRRFRYVEGTAASLCQLYGYERIDTPVFEDAGLFVRTIGSGTDIVEKETYTFEDRSGQAMTLRPEGTAPICRAYIEHGMHNLPQPVRLYYIASIFRYERPQRGRYRQHQQFGAEAIGDGDPALDAEVIDLAWRLFDSLGMRNLSLFLNSIGCRACRPAYLEELKRHYSAYREQLCADCRARLVKNPLRLLDCKKPSCQSVAQSAPHSTDYLCSECAAHFGGVTTYLSLLGIPFQTNHRLVRGLDYYTKTVFEVQPEGEQGAQSALGGGGRYDGLIEELGGRPTPAVGFAVGIERVVLNMKQLGVDPQAASGCRVFVAYLGDEAKAEAMRLAAELRQGGIAVVSSFGDRSLKAQLRQANAVGAAHAAILGEDEVRTGIVMLRDMAKGRQEPVPSGDLVRVLAATLGGFKA